MYCFVKHSVIFQYLKITSKRADNETQITVQLLFYNIIFWKKIRALTRTLHCCFSIMLKVVITIYFDFIVFSFSPDTKSACQHRFSRKSILAIITTNKVYYFVWLILVFINSGTVCSIKVNGIQSFNICIICNFRCNLFFHFRTRYWTARICYGILAW